MVKVRSTPDRAVLVRALSGGIMFVLVQDTYKRSVSLSNMIFWEYSNFAGS